MTVPYITGDPYIDADFASATANSGVSAGTYGDATHVPRITVDAGGKITAASSVAISGAQTLTGTVATTDATPTTIVTTAIASDTSVLLNLNVVARRTGGLAGTAGDAGGYVLSAIVKNIAGTVTIVGQTVIFTGADQIAWTAAFAVSTTNILVQVTGAADNNVNWSASGSRLAVA